MMSLAKVRFLLFYAAILSCCGAVSQGRPVVFGPFKGMRSLDNGHTSVMRDTIKAKAWIEAMVREMRGQEVFCSDCRIAEPAINDAAGFERISYRLRDHVQLAFSNGSKVEVRCHSSHQDPEVGDVTLAMDTEGLVFVNFSHICGGIVQFYDSNFSGEPGGKPVLPKDAGTFFSKYLCDTDDAGWELWKPAVRH